MLHSEVEKLKKQHKHLEENKLHIEKNLVYMKLGQYLNKIDEKRKAYEYLIKAKNLGLSAAYRELSVCYC